MKRNEQGMVNNDVGSWRRDLHVEGGHEGLHLGTFFCVHFFFL